MFQRKAPRDELLSHLGIKYVENKIQDPESKVEKIWAFGAEGREWFDDVIFFFFLQPQILRIHL